MTPLTWAILLLAFGLLLVVVELFVPSGGVLGFISLASIVAAIVMAFRYSSYTGLTFLALAVFGVPALLALGLQVWPRTPMGRRILLDVPRGDDVLPDQDHRKQLKELIGQVGKSKTLKLPGGPIEVAGRTYDAVSEGQPIQPDTPVKIVDVRGTRIVVRPTAERPTIARNADDPLNQSIESIGLDPFEDPLV
jgi:membrane-bound ClpP family serine protease